jgi:hypothetical protein
VESKARRIYIPKLKARKVWIKLSSAISFEISEFNIPIFCSLDSGNSVFIYAVMAFKFRFSGTDGVDANSNIRFSYSVLPTQHFYSRSGILLADFIFFKICQKIWLQIFVF